MLTLGLKVYQNIETLIRGELRRVYDLRWFFAIILIILGASLIALEIDQIGNIGNFFLKIIGILIIFVAGLIVRTKKD